MTTKLKRALDEDKAQSGMSWEQYCQGLGVPYNTLKHWREIGSTPTGQYRVIIEQRFGPEVLEKELGFGPQITQLVTDEDEGAPAKAVDPVMNRVNQILAKEHIYALSRLLLWFLFEANAEQRQELRESLGEDGEVFQNLVRAMAGEMAFKVLSDEGKLNKGDRK
mgnify:CR=1 FL=1